MMSSNNQADFQNCASEILIKFFSFLNPIQHSKCREVCWQWKNIVDSLIINEDYWWKHCRNDFRDVYKIAYLKRTPALSCQHLYRSLHLWPKLYCTTENCTEFPLENKNKDILGFQLLRYGQISIHTRTGILYFDIVTRKPSHHVNIPGNYLLSVENDDTIVILGRTSHLYISRKILRKPCHEKEFSVSFVKNFVLIDNAVYYITLENNIYICNLLKDKLGVDLVAQLNTSVMCLGYANGYLHALTYNCKIFTYFENKLCVQQTLDNSHLILTRLIQCNLLEHLDWKAYYQWMFALKHTVPDSFRDINVLKIYRDKVFIGFTYGVLSIYQYPQSKTSFDLFNLTLVKQINFMNYDSPVLLNSAIIQIDIIEGKDSHKVIVGMPNKIVALEFIHDFKL